MNLLQRPHAGVPPEVATFAVVSEHVKHGCSEGSCHDRTAAEAAAAWLLRSERAGQRC